MIIFEPMKNFFWKWAYEKWNFMKIFVYLIYYLQPIYPTPRHPQALLPAQYGRSTPNRSHLAAETMLPKTHINFWCAFLATRFGLPNAIWCELGPHIWGPDWFYAYQTCANAFVGVAAQKNRYIAIFGRPRFNAKFGIIFWDDENWRGIDF